MPGKVSAMIRLRRLARLRAMALGRKSSSTIARSMRSRVAAEIGRVLLMAYETVLSETWARVATSCMVAMSPPSSSLTVCRAAVIVPVVLSRPATASA